MTNKLLICARFGDDNELRALIKSANPTDLDALVNFVEPETLNTPLHMACANGHITCVQELLQNGSKHLPNINGNYPLHWAVQNKHREIVKLLVESINDLDVLARNNFGRGCVTEAFQCEDTEILAILLEHSSATEERLAEGTGMDKDAIKEETEIDNDHKLELSLPKILQETVLEFEFAPDLPTLRIRELALEWSKDAFGSRADEDITGVSIWSAALILSRWVLDHCNVFNQKQVCELGSGCGVSGLAVYQYTSASRVVLSDLFTHTLENLAYNVALNSKDILKTTETKVHELQMDCCGRCGAIQRFSIENPEGKLMTCGGCKAIVYCSRECQKKAWKRHKIECQKIQAQRQKKKMLQHGSIQVKAIDWAQCETWSIQCDQDRYDVLFGSDLVYHDDIVPILVNVVDGMLSKTGQFIHIASQARHSLIEFQQAMTVRGFSCQIDQVPEEYKTNPLVDTNALAELFTLHFNEMSDTYCTYIFTRTME